MGAYLTQEMGFSNVSRLAGGIVAYDRALTNRREEEEAVASEVDGDMTDDDDSVGYVGTVRMVDPEGNTDDQDKDQDEDDENEPMFKGTNFVFDGRVGRQITDDAMGDCVTCSKKTNLVGNCSNRNCNTRTVQCAKCRTKFSGSCSDACRGRVVFVRERAADRADAEKAEEKEE